MASDNTGMAGAPVLPHFGERPLSGGSKEQRMLGLFVCARCVARLFDRLVLLASFLQILWLLVAFAHEPSQLLVGEALFIAITARGH